MSFGLVRRSPSLARSASCSRDSVLNIESAGPIRILRLTSNGGDNRLTRACVLAICAAIHELRKQQLPLIIPGNPGFFSVGADLNELSQLSGPDALEVAHLGQSLVPSL